MSNANSSKFPAFEPGSDEFQVEQMLASVKDYVVPTDQLRPKVLEAAQVLHLEKVGSRWVGRFVLISAFAFWGLAIATPFLQAIQANSIKDRTFVEQRSIELFESGGVEIQSATSQAYAEWRESLNKRLHPN